ncbi:bacterial alpha-L-rhamnosidase domain-containing protein [Paraphoma chrysanthemicola]|uniref:Bacterial alpha-L-rhamnosidase domain-containing protein n=1 Tax=Paraphoma chrysanthemicola TaxID=798071 RepID=A0A8K0W2K6_9PLEO|nr:bacterial alpha-L-rhamnosidase domain-containing protein [Paraphoma chrysanthemicola]
MKQFKGSAHFASQFLSFLVFVTTIVSANPWDSYIYSPASRNVKPAAIHSLQSPVIVTGKTGDQGIALAAGGRISLDFGVEVGGWITLNADVSVNTNNSTPQFALAFAESPAYVRTISDDTGSTPTQDWDQALNVSLPRGSTLYRTPVERFRGGFRFLTITAYQDVTISNVTCEIGFAPETEHLRDYGGHFYTPDDDLLVRTWYAGAYTIQTNIGPPNTGRFLPQVRPGWAYNATLGIGNAILLDGAKRDRAVWPGDLGLQGITAFLSLGVDGLSAYRNALETLFYYQNATTGRFPFAGPATGSFRNGAQSDTYHAWSLIAIYNYAIFTGDGDFIAHHWTNITKGVDFILTALNDNEYGLHNQTRPNDWARQGGGGYNSALNALDYHALFSLSSLATSWTNDTAIHSQATNWSTAASRLKASYNTLLWSPSLNLYHDNQTTTLAPQDGNALALLYNLTTSPTQTSSLSASLTRFWTPLGPVTPELPDTISPFISSIEVLAHFSANQPLRALNLTRTLWSYLLDSPLMTGSTLAEGLSANGSLYYRGNAGYRNDAAYTSLSHGWSSGPTSALSMYVAGLEVVGWRRWRFRPLVGDLKSVTSGFDGPLGRFGVEWRVVGGEGNGTWGFEANVTTPVGTRGVVDLAWNCESVLVDGRVFGGEEVAGGGVKEVRAGGCR